MSKAKDAYYKNYKIGITEYNHVLTDKVTNYVTELEQQNSEMLLALVIEYRCGNLIRKRRAKQIIEKTTGKSIDEVLSDDKV